MVKSAPPDKAANSLKNIPQLSKDTLGDIIISEVLKQSRPTGRACFARLAN
jgi:hypothetical protein